MKIILKKQVEDDDHVIFIDKLDIPKEGECKAKEKDISTAWYFFDFCYNMRVIRGC